MVNPADLIARQWFTHTLTVHEPGKRNALGEVMRGTAHTVAASVDATARTVTDPNGREVVASAVCRWHVDDVLPQPGWTVDLPAHFGLKPGRTIITAKRAATGTGMTPDFVEVSLQ